MGYLHVKETVSKQKELKLEKKNHSKQTNL